MARAGEPGKDANPAFEHPRPGGLGKDPGEETLVEELPAQLAEGVYRPAGP